MDRRKALRLVTILGLYYWQVRLLLLRKRRRTKWVRPIYLKRIAQGHFDQLLKDLYVENDDDFIDFFRMNRKQFDDLLELVGPKIQKKRTCMREPIGPTERLAVTLRFLASGSDYATLGNCFRISPPAISKIVPATCNALSECLQPLVLPSPTTAKFEEVANHFNTMWQLPNCAGTIGGRHVMIKSPVKSGSQSFDHKKSRSIVLIGIIDANFKFLGVSLGDYGRNSGAEVFDRSIIGRKIIDGTLELPPDKPLPNGSPPMPHVFIGDETFPLLQSLMTPFPSINLSPCEEVYNFRLSKASEAVEKAFGIMSAKFLVFRKPINLHPNNVHSVIKACVCLHNYLRRDIKMANKNIKIVEHPSAALRPLDKVGRQAPSNAVDVRGMFKDYYFSSPGVIA